MIGSVQFSICRIYGRWTELHYKFIVLNVSLHTYIHVMQSKIVFPSKTYLFFYAPFEGGRAYFFAAVRLLPVGLSVGQPIVSVDFLRRDCTY